MSDAEELDRIANRIQALFEAAKGAERPYYVSALGIELGPDLQTLKSLTKGTLASFIASRFAGKYEVARLGPHGNILAVIPVGSEPPELGVSGPARDAQGREKYHYRLWAAFSVPPSADTRWLNMNDLTFIDTSREDGPPADALEIPVDMIPAEDLPRRDDAIWESVTRWLNDNGLARERFLAPARKALHAPQPRTAGTSSVLEAVIQALDRRQLQTTHLPLDVVAALLHARHG